MSVMQSSVPHLWYQWLKTERGYVDNRVSNWRLICTELLRQSKALINSHTPCTLDRLFCLWPPMKRKKKFLMYTTLYNLTFSGWISHTWSFLELFCASAKNLVNTSLPLLWTRQQICTTVTLPDYLELQILFTTREKNSMTTSFTLLLQT